jgi:hypothetical protein
MIAGVLHADGGAPAGVLSRAGRPVQRQVRRRRRGTSAQCSACKGAQYVCILTPPCHSHRPSPRASTGGGCVSPGLGVLQSVLRRLITTHLAHARAQNVHLYKASPVYTRRLHAHMRTCVRTHARTHTHTHTHTHRVVCAYCNLVLSEWSPKDDPVRCVCVCVCVCVYVRACRTTLYTDWVDPGTPQPACCICL